MIKKYIPLELIWFDSSKSPIRQNSYSTDRNLFDLSLIKGGGVSRKILFLNEFLTVSLLIEFLLYCTLNCLKYFLLKANLPDNLSFRWRHIYAKLLCDKIKIVGDRRSNKDKVDDLVSAHSQLSESTFYFKLSEWVCILFQI